jgi:hypothetical protein
VPDACMCLERLRKTVETFGKIVGIMADIIINLHTVDRDLGGKTRSLHVVQPAVCIKKSQYDMRMMYNF